MTRQSRVHISSSLGSLLLLCAMITPIAAGQSRDTLVLSAEWMNRVIQSSRGIPWFTTALYHPGDDPDWARTDLDDSTWRPYNPEFITTERNPLARLNSTLDTATWPGMGWFRVHLRVDESLWGTSMGIAIRHWGASAIYLNGRRIHQVGTIGTTPEQEQAGANLYPSTLTFDHQPHQVLAIRYSNTQAVQLRADKVTLSGRKMYVPGFQVYVGAVEAIHAHRLHRQLHKGILTVAMLAFALIHGILFMFYPAMRSNLFFALFALFSSAIFFDFLQGGFHTSFGAWYQTRFFFTMGFPFAFVALLRFIYEVFYTRLPVQFYAFLAVGMLAAFGLTWFPSRITEWVLFAYVPLSVFEILRVVSLALWKKKRWAWIMGIGFLSTIFAFADFLLRRVVSTSVLGEFPGGVPISLYAIFILLLSISVYLARTFSQVSRDLTASNAQLEQRVEDRTRKLKENNDVLVRTLHDLKTTQAQLIQQEKMASLGQLTAGIAHEIKNPLNFINNFAEVNEELVTELRETLTPTDDVGELIEDLAQNSRVIAEHGQRADAIVQSMMRHARGKEEDRGTVGLNPFVDEYVNLAYHGMRAKNTGFNVSLNCQYDPAVGDVVIAPQELGRVLINLLNNAFDAVYAWVQEREDAAYEPVVTIRTQKMQDSITIQIADNGPGIPPLIQQKIFEPFFTTKPAGAGTGLGLSLSYDIITQGHGGMLTVESEESEGTCFTITLPYSPSNGTSITP